MKFGIKMIYILLLGVFTSSLFGSYQISYFDDATHYKNIEDVLDKEFLPSSGKKTFGKKKYLWLKVEITNATQQKEENYLSFRHIHVLKDVHFFTVKNNIVIKQNTSFHKYNNPNVENRIGNILLFKNEILAHEKIEVYIYMTAKSNIYHDIHNGSLIEVMSKASKSSSMLLILIGILSALGVFYLFLYLFTPNKEYLYYTLLVTSISLWGFYIYGGYAYYFDMFNVVKFSNTFMIFLPIFTTLFFQSIFKNEKRFEKYNKVLNTLLVFLFIALAYYVLGTVGLFTPKYTISMYLPILYIINLLTIMFIGIRIYLDKLPYSGLFLLAYSANFLGVIVSLAFFHGKIEYTEFTFFGNMIGGAVEAILFSILLTYRMKTIYKEKEDALKAIEIQKIKADVMSDTIDFISHQWRQPLSQINASVLELDDITYKNNIKINELDNELLCIENTTQYMSSTIDDYRNFFSNTKEKEVFLLDKVIFNIISIVKKNIENSNINLEINTEEELYINANKGDISQTILVIVNNARDVLLQRKVLNPTITIKLFSSDDFIYINISDNAGGIDSNIKNKIFNAHYTTKDKSKGSGLGLYIAKMTIETKMGGKIKAKDIDNGVCFSIELQKEDKNG